MDDTRATPPPPTLTREQCVRAQYSLQHAANSANVAFVPDNDLKPHRLNEHCWCKPRYIGDGIYSHNSLDGREEFENGRKLS